MKASVRINALTLGGPGPATLNAMELHGKRLDTSSQVRRIRDVAPLVHGGLDLRHLYEDHVTGCRQNAALKKPVMHALVQFPTQLGRTEAERELMMKHAIAFINKTHGGRAVFAARFDQDEAGTSVVDVFYSPKYVKTTKNRKGEVVHTDWISTTKFGKDLCHKHREEIERRHKGKFTTGPRQVGISMQAELHDYLTSAGLRLEPRTEKVDRLKDRVDPEVYKAREDARRELAEARADLEAARKYRKEAKAHREAATEELLAARAVIQVQKDEIKGWADRVMSAFKIFTQSLGFTAPDDMKDAAEAIEGVISEMTLGDAPDEPGM